MARAELLLVKCQQSPPFFTARLQLHSMESWANLAPEEIFLNKLSGLTCLLVHRLIGPLSCSSLPCISSAMFLSFGHQDVCRHQLCSLEQIEKSSSC